MSLPILQPGARKTPSRQAQGLRKPLKMFTLRLTMPSGEQLFREVPRSRVRWQDVANIAREAGLSPHPPAANTNPWLVIKAEVLDGSKLRHETSMRVKQIRIEKRKAGGK